MDAGKGLWKGEPWEQIRDRGDGLLRPFKTPYKKGTAPKLLWHDKKGIIANIYGINTTNIHKSIYRLFKAGLSCVDTYLWANGWNAKFTGIFKAGFHTTAVYSLTPGNLSEIGPKLGRCSPGAGWRQLSCPVNQRYSPHFWGVRIIAPWMQKYPRCFWPVNIYANDYTPTWKPLYRDRENPYTVTGKAPIQT